jgi:type I restriction enzyme, S subunit
MNVQDLQPYSDLKRSGLAWLGDIPAHWDVLRSKYVFREVDSRSKTGEETHLSMSQRLGLVPANQIERTLVSESYVGAKLVSENDLVLNRLKAHLGVFAHAKQSGLISPDYTVLRPLSCANVRFFEYVLKSASCRAELRTRAKGIVEGFWRLYTDDLYDIRLPTPPLDEQRLIVRFLDWHGVQTAKLIRTKKKIIALLNEQKQTIIHRAVTRGLDPNVRLRPSDIPWLGDVPEGWEVSKLKRLARLRSGESITAFQIEDSGAFPVYGGNGHRGYTTRYTHEGDFVLIGRQGALCGNIHRATDRFFASEHAIVAHPRTEYEVRWFEEMLRVMNLNQYSIAAAQPGLSVERIEVLGLPVPSTEEQAHIVHWIDRETTELHAAITLANREIALIQEFRTRLIADVVTGKLDVRAAAASLPENTALEATDAPVEDYDLDEAIDDAENEEVAA